MIFAIVPPLARMPLAFDGNPITVASHLITCNSTSFGAWLKPARWAFIDAASISDIIASGVKLDQVIFARTWVHVGYLHPKTRAQRNEKLSMFVVGGKTTYEPYNANDSRIA